MAFEGFLFVYVYVTGLYSLLRFAYTKKFFSQDIYTSKNSKATCCYGLNWAVSQDIYTSKATLNMLLWVGLGCLTGHRHQQEQQSYMLLWIGLDCLTGHLHQQGYIKHVVMDWAVSQDIYTSKNSKATSKCCNSLNGYVGSTSYLQACQARSSDSIHSPVMDINPPKAALW